MRHCLRRFTPNNPRGTPTDKAQPPRPVRPLSTGLRDGLSRGIPTRSRPGRSCCRRSLRRWHAHLDQIW
jgi:hypothetical protein